MRPGAPRSLCTALTLVGLVTAAHAEGEAAASPGRPKLVLTLAEPSPVIGLTGETVLTIEVVQAAATPMPLPRVLCSVGQIEDLGREGPAKFSARYILPTSRYPQPAILAAEIVAGGRPLRGSTTVALRAATTLAFATNPPTPGARVTMRVGDRDFGPRIAGPDGRVHVPVVVPPGVSFAVARAVNPQGAASEQMVDLHVPYSQRLLLVAPKRLAAGATGEVAVYAVDASGRPANGADLVLGAGPRRVQPLGSEALGEASFLVTAPTLLRQASMRIEAQLKGDSTTVVAARIPLVPGPAGGLMLLPEGPALEDKPGASLRVFLGAQDAFGNPVDAGQASVLVDGTPARVSADNEGDPMVVLQRPAQPRPAVVVEAVLDGARTVSRVPVGLPVHAAAARQAPYLAFPRYSLTPRLGVLTNFGPLVGGTLFVEGLVYPSAHDPGLGLGLAIGLVQSGFSAESLGATSRVDMSVVPLSVQVRQQLVVGRAFVALGAGAGVAEAVARVHTYGATTVGTSLGGMAEASLETGVILHKAHLVIALRYLGLFLSDFSSGDRLAANAGGAVADVGYRRVW